MRHTADRTRRLASPATLVSASIVVSFAFFFVLWAKPWGAAAGVIVDDIAENLAVVLACVLCALRASRCHGRDRRGWSLIAVFMGLWLAGGAIWFWYDLTGAAMPFPSVADIAFLLAVPAAAVGLLSLPSPGTSTTPVRRALDGILTSASVLFIAWAFLIGALIAADGAEGFADLVALAYPLGDVVILAIALTLFARAGRSRTTALILAGGVAAIAVSDAAYAWISLFRPAVAGDLTGAGWLLGFLLIAIAAATSTPERQGAVMALPPRSASPMVVHGSVIASLLVAVYLLATGRGLAGGLAWIEVIILVLVVVRQWLTTVEVAEVQRELRALAFQDGLTGLANRWMLETTVEKRLDRGLSMTVLLFDLDKFKVVNDTHGHRAGDAVLIEVARRLKAVVGPDSLVARIGGDEFAVMLPAQLTSAAVEAIAGRLEKALRDPVEVDGHVLPLSASIGVTTSHAGTGSLGQLLREADVAMYEAKRAGGRSFVISILGPVPARGSAPSVRRRPRGSLVSPRPAPPAPSLRALPA